VVESRREIKGQVSTERRYYIASHRTLDAQRTAEGIRYHWGIENQAHWVLDVIFNEDQCRIRRENGRKTSPACGGWCSTNCGPIRIRREKTVPAHETQMVQLEFCPFP